MQIESSWATRFTSRLASTGFIYNANGAPVEIVGAGELVSRIKGQDGGSYALLRLFGGPGTSIHDLDIQFPANVAANTIGLWTNAHVKHINVYDSPATNVNTRWGVDLDPGTLEDTNVQMDLHGQTGGVSFQSPGSTVRDSGINARIGVGSFFGGTVDRTVIGASASGVAGTRNQTTITSSLIYTYDAKARGIDASASAEMAVVADGVDIVGSDPGAVAVAASSANAPASNVSVTFRNSLIRNFTTSLSGSASGAGTTKIAASYSDYKAANGATGANASIAEDHISNIGNVGFDSDQGWAPLPGSPLIDAGDPTAGQALDLMGNPLVTDGDHDGVARRDIGAYELPGPLPGQGGDQAQPTPPADQPLAPPATPAADKQAPMVSRFMTVHRSFTVGRARTAVSAKIFRGTVFRYKLTEAAKVVVKIRRARMGRIVGKLIRTGRTGANSIRFSGRVGRRALKPGSYRAVATATDAAGNTSTPKSVKFRVVAG